jgi:hypothetical protein
MRLSGGSRGAGAEGLKPRTGEEAGERVRGEGRDRFETRSMRGESRGRGEGRDTRWSHEMRSPRERRARRARGGGWWEPFAYSPTANRASGREKGRSAKIKKKRLDNILVRFNVYGKGCGAVTFCMNSTLSPPCTTVRLFPNMLQRLRSLYTRCLTVIHRPMIGGQGDEVLART